jgi:hypothetical protein
MGDGYRQHLTIFLRPVYRVTMRGEVRSEDVHTQNKLIIQEIEDYESK